MIQTQEVQLLVSDMNHDTSCCAVVDRGKQREEEEDELPSSCGAPIDSRDLIGFISRDVGPREEAPRGRPCPPPTLPPALPSHRRPPPPSSSSTSPLL